MRIFFFIFLSIIFSCKNKKDKEITEKSEVLKNQTIPETNSRIEEIESISFRRTYVGHENLSDKDLEELYKSNPSLEIYNPNSKIVKKLNQINFLKNADLLLSKFENKKLKREYLDDNKKIALTCNYDSLSNAKIQLSIEFENKRVIKTIDFEGNNIVGIRLRDIDNDNIKEVLILTNYYIMNGDNFLLTILKYK